MEINPLNKPRRPSPDSLPTFFSFIILFVGLVNYQWKSSIFFQKNPVFLAPAYFTFKVINPKIQVYGATTFRNEGEYLVEWIDYHLKLKFDKLFLIDNNDLGDEKEFTQLIQDKYPRQVVYINSQNTTYAESKKNYQKLADNLTWNEWLYTDLNVDEFLTFSNESGISDVHQYVEKLIDNNCDLVLTNWLIYGNNGKKKKEPGSVIERFPLPVTPLNWVKRFGIPENCHTKPMGHGGFEKNVSVHWWTPTTKGIVICGGDCQKFEKSKFTHSVAYIRHYFTKSDEEWATSKQKKHKRHLGQDYYDWGDFDATNKYPPNTVH